MRSALLRGREHVELGAVSAIAEGDAAVAISRGGAPKRYEHTEPNEDAALFACGEGGTLLAVADGHAGAGAAECALAHLLEEHAPEWTAAGGSLASEPAWRETALGALARANTAILRAAAESPFSPPRTTLSLVLVRPREDALLFAAVGDSLVFRATPAGVMELATPVDENGRVGFLGSGDETPDSLREKSACGLTPLGDSYAVALVTDGISEVGIGVEDPPAAVEDALVAADRGPAETRPLEAAKAIVHRALRAQRRNRSGDNVACAMVWLAG
jgi:serine/threonine protein phosphatase PrpC